MSSSPDQCYEYITIESKGPVLHVRLNRPEVHNALNGAMIGELTDCFRAIRAGEGVRAVVLSGEGRSFCAGADLGWMQTVAGFTREQNLWDAYELADMLAAINDCPVPVVARVHGAALGGGAGVVSCCDVAVADAGTRFGFTEVKLGIVPAVISPYVVAKIGRGHARALFTTGERFDAQRALLIGLVHFVAGTDELDAVVEAQVEELLTSAPLAASEAKQLVREVADMTMPDARVHTAHTIARLRASPEGREGMAAFLEKRKPSWVEQG